MCKAVNGRHARLRDGPREGHPGPAAVAADGAIEPWATAIRNRSGWTCAYIEKHLQALRHPLDVPLNKLAPPPARRPAARQRREDRVPLQGSASEYRFQSRVEGILNTLARRLKETKSEDARAYYMKYFSDRICSDCGGDRLRAEARHVRVDGHGIVDLSRMPVGTPRRDPGGLALEGSRQRVAADLIREIRTRLRFLINVGLDYLTLDRLGPSLSGGESQRIRLASQVGTELTGVTYVLDEPSIGLHPEGQHPADPDLQHLRDLGNTVVVVEHDRETIHSADHVIDFARGRASTAARWSSPGRPAKLCRSRASLTGQYCPAGGRSRCPRSGGSPAATGWCCAAPATHNLKGIDCRIPWACSLSSPACPGAGRARW